MVLPSTYLYLDIVHISETDTFCHPTSPYSTVIYQFSGQLARIANRSLDVRATW